MGGSPKVVLLAVVVWLCFGHPAAAQTDAFQRRRAEARTELVKAQLALADWCNSKELFQERDRVYTRILSLEPDNLEARKGLRFGRNPDGSWKDPSPRESKNRNPKALAEFPEQRGKSVARYRDALIELLASEAPDPTLRRAVFDEILLFDPDDARVHEICVETKSDDKWVLSDTVAAKARRAEIKALVSSSKASAPVATEAQATLEEAALATWKVQFATPSMRILSTGDEAEARTIVTSCLAAKALIDGLFAVETKLPEGYTVFVLANVGEKDPFVEHLPNLTSVERTFVKGLQSAGIHENRHVALFDADPRRRLDNAIRHTVGHLLASAYQISPHHGWVWEGAGLYLTRELCGTRLTWFISKPQVEEEKAQQALRSVLLNSDTNWMNEALKLFDGDAAPKLDQVMRRDPNAMTMQDMLASYALVAYLIEARSPDASELFRRAGASVDPVPAVQEVLGLSVPELEDRMKRWLRERR